LNGDASRDEVRNALDAIYKSESRCVLATLIRLLGDFELAEDALHEAVMAAMEQWPRDGIPANPRSWLISAGRFKTIDQMRRLTRMGGALDELESRFREEPFDPTQWDEQHLEDDRLRLIFTCCHPALPFEARTAITLREVCGLTTEEIARAFVTSVATVAKRIVRAKTKIRDARIPYIVPQPNELPSRLDSVLQVIYLIFTEGYSASSGPSLTRADLSAEAIRLGRLLLELLPEPEVLGLLALMLLQEARRSARVSTQGDLILLDDQDRSLWNRNQIDEGVQLVERALASRRFGPYTLQAAIAAVHSEATTPAATDWDQICGLYDVLLRADPSPVIDLNRAIAIAMRDGPPAGLEIVERILNRGDLQNYYLAHVSRADLHRRLGNTDQAILSYRRALTLAGQDPARRFLQRRLEELLGQ
jgi:RNA polymerase sigma-70 factor (ECF subfamily)